MEAGWRQQGKLVLMRAMAGPPIQKSKFRNANHETHEKARKERDLRMIGLSLTG